MSHEKWQKEFFVTNLICRIHRIRVGQQRGDACTKFLRLWWVFPFWQVTFSLRCVLIWQVTFNHQCWSSKWTSLIWLSWVHPCRSNGIASYRSQYFKWNIFGELLYGYGKSSSQERRWLRFSRDFVCCLFALVHLIWKHCCQHTVCCQCYKLRYIWYETSVASTVCCQYKIMSLLCCGTFKV